jgi:hypothetical protein
MKNISKYVDKFMRSDLPEALLLIAVFALGIFVVLASGGCTRQTWNRNFGGKMRIDLPPGQELMEATWKEDSLFYLTRPMASNYVPVTKTFAESSPYGLLESTVEFVERR